MNLASYFLQPSAKKIGEQFAKYIPESNPLPNYVDVQNNTPLGQIDNAVRIDRSDSLAEKQYWRSAAVAIKENIGASLDVLSAMQSPLVFDIIYQPTETLLLYWARLTGCRTLNGEGMNLEQAVIAYDKTTEAIGLRMSDRESVRSFMAPLW